MLVRPAGAALQRGRGEGRGHSEDCVIAMEQEGGREGRRQGRRRQPHGPSLSIDQVVRIRRLAGRVGRGLDIGGAKCCLGKFSCPNMIIYFWIFIHKSCCYI